MNGENRKIAVQEEMQRADKAFRAAELLYENGMKYREEADYNPSYTFTSRDYDEFREEVLGVSNRIKQYLKDSGF